MANAIYDKYKEEIMTTATNTNLLTETVKVSLVNSDVTLFNSTNEFYSDLNSTGGIVATATLANKSVTNGVLNADDIVFPSVANTNPESEALLFWIDTGVDTTSRLVCWLDTNITGFPITPDGSNVDITWSTSGIFKL